MPLPLRTRLWVPSATVAGLAVFAAFASADDGPRFAPPAPPPQAAPAQPAPPAQPTPMTAQQLDEMVAPVALYPDVVLYSMLPATAAPGDLTAAALYVAEAGGKVDGPPEGSNWDPNVVAMLQYPDVLKWMSENPSWIEQVGYAMTNQQADVLAAIQRYRAKANQAGALQSNEYQKVIVQNPRPDASVIVIQPTSPQVVYVPSYDPYPVLDPGWTYQPYRPFFSGWFGYSFSTGPWAWNEIAWGYPGYYGAFYVHDDPWWWYGHRHYGGAYYGSRPYLWRPTYRNDWTWSRYGWRPQHTVRPTTTAIAPAATAGRDPRRATVTMRPTGSVRPSARVATSPQTTPSPVLRPDPNRVRRTEGGATVTTQPRTRTTFQPGSGVTVPTPTPRVGTTVAPSPTPRVNPTPRAIPTPRVTPNPGMNAVPRRTTWPRFDSTPQGPNPRVTTNPRARSYTGVDPRVNVWSRRGNASLKDDDAVVRTTPRVVQTPRVPQNAVPAPRATPRVRVEPTRPRDDRDRDEKEKNDRKR